MPRFRTPSMQLSRAQAWALGLGAYVLVYLSWQLWHWLPGGQELGQLFLPPMDLAALVAALMASQRTVACRRLQLFWRLMAAAIAAQLVGDAILAVNVLSYAQPPFPSWADAAFLASFALLFAALLRVPVVRGSRSQRARMVLDGATIVLGGGVGVWYFLIGPTAIAGADTPFALVVSLAYPMFDLILLAGLSALLLRRSPPLLRTPLLLIAAGVVLSVVADTVYGAGLLHGTYTNGDPVDTLYVLEFALFALAAAHQQPVRPRALDDARDDYRQPAARATWLPYLALAIGVTLVLGVEVHDTFFPDFSLLLVVVLLATLVAIRQVIVQRDLLRLQAALRESERRSRAIFDTAAVGITFTDLDGPAIVDVNQTFARMVGSTPEQLRGQDYGSIATPEYQDADGALADAFRSGEIDQLQQELAYRSADGTTRWAMLTISTMRDTQGTPTHVVGVFEDITRRREAERMKDELVSVVGHELRTPLTSIRGSLGLLAAGVVGELPQEANELVTIAIANTDRLTRLVNDTLDIERLEAGRLELERAPVAARALVEQAVQAVQAAADAAGVVLDVDAEELTVDVDGDRVVQALINLLGNAIKFSPTHDVVSVVVRADADADVASFSVHDRGRGIPADKLEAIFERFDQVDASDAREKGGTGLGLAIARGIVDAHGGRIWAESTPGDGATFQMTLPLAQPAALVPSPLRTEVTA